MIISLSSEISKFTKIVFHGNMSENSNYSNILRTFKRIFILKGGENVNDTRGIFHEDMCTRTDSSIISTPPICAVS